MPTPLKLCILCLSLAVTSCSAAIGVESQNKISKEQKSISSPQSEQIFSVFFSKYRELVIQDNYEEIAEVTLYPFTFKGSLDSDGIIEVNKESFLALLPTFMALETDVMFANESYQMPAKLSIISTPEEPVILSKSEVRLHDFVFTKIDGVWFFSKAYTQMDELNIANKE